MSVDSKAIVRANVSLEQIVDCLSTEFSDIEVLNTNTENFFRVHFSNSSGKTCVMWVSYNFADNLAEKGINGIAISSSFRYDDGIGAKAVKLVVETFGGYYDENDCDDEGFVPVNIHLLEQGGGLSELEKFKHKVIAKVGFSKLNDILELLNSYLAVHLSNENILNDFRKSWQGKA